MANIFKTTLKKDIISDIVDHNRRDIRFPITKFWSNRFAVEYNIEDKTFVFKTFDYLELYSPSNSSPSNKETNSITYTFEFVKIYVDGDEFVIEFKDVKSECEENCLMDDSDYDDEVENLYNTIVSEDYKESECQQKVSCEDNDNVELDDTDDNLELEQNEDDTLDNVSNNKEYIDVESFDLIKHWFENEGILDNFYENQFVFATNARQVLILPKGKVLGFNKLLPLTNDVEVRVEFDMSEKIYNNSITDLTSFESDIYKILNEISKNNFVFVWKRHTGIFMDENGIYFRIKYSTRKSIGFNRKYNVQ